VASIGDEFEIGELILFLGIAGAIIYFLHKWLSTSTCLANLGSVPGITGASQSQVDAAKTAANTLKPGGKVVWSCGSDFDYQQPCGTVTQARHNPVNYIWPWANPVTYTCVPASCASNIPCNCGLFQAGAGGA
jgi:hypothetical protein